MERISCIIPAYNEEKGLGSVLTAIADHPLLAEVIVIDDGSTDRTKDIVRSFPTVKLLVNEQNMGKTATICRGIEESAHPYVLLLDADLTGLTPEAIDDLIEPIRTGSADVSLSLRNYYFWRLTGGIDPLTGDRLMPKRLLLSHLDELRALPHYALEVYINSLLIKDGYTFAVVPWLGVYGPFKAMKYGIITGMQGEVRMWKSITSYMPFSEFIHQFLTMRRLAKGRRALLPKLFF